MVFKSHFSFKASVKFVGEKISLFSWLESVCFKPSLRHYCRLNGKLNISRMIFRIKVSGRGMLKIPLFLFLPSAKNLSTVSSHTR